MTEAIALSLLRLLGRLPLAFNQQLGQILGRVIFRLSERQRCVALVNLALCFPDASRHWRRTTARRSAGSMAAALLEAPRLWKMDAHALRRRLVNPEALEEVLQCYRTGRGVVIASPHLGSWEYAGLIFAAHAPMSSMFQPPKLAEIQDFVHAGRQHVGGQLVPANTSGIRAMLKALSQGNCVGILPDQEPERGAGVFAEFFKQPASTMYLLPRLVQKNRAPVVFVFAERLRGGRFRLHLQWGGEALYSTDPKIACQAVNDHVEELVKRCPAQYNWIYKRFREQPDGRQVYQTGCPRQ